MAGDDAMRPAAIDVSTRDAPSWPQPAPETIGPSPSTGVPAQPTSSSIAPSKAPDGNATRKTGYSPAKDDYISNAVPSGLTDIDSDGRLQDANGIPGMNLLLSLTLRLVPNAKDGEMSNAFDFTEAPPVLPSGSGTGQEHPLLKHSGPNATAQSNLTQPAASVVSPPSSSSTSAVSHQLHEAKSPSMLESIPNITSMDNTLLRPFAQANVPPNSASCLPSAFGSLDHTAQLDSLASAASETAAHEYGKVPLYPKNGNPSATVASIPTLLPPSQSSANYLPVMQQAPLGLPSLGTVQDAAPGTVTVEAARATTTSKAPNTVLLGQSNPQASLPASSGVPMSRDASLDSQSSLFSLPTSEPDFQQSGRAKLERDFSAPDRLGHSVPVSLQHMGEDEAQRKAIEAAVQNLNTHHQLAQTAALQHHQQKMGIPLKSAPEQDRKRTLEPTNGEAKRTRPSTPTPAEVKSKALGGSMPVHVEMQRSASANDLGSQKRFQCPKCSRAFARAYNLNTHLSTHDPDPSRAKPFPCPYKSCKAEGGRSFSRKHDLQRHVASVHEWEPEPGVNERTGEVVEGGDTGGLASLGLGAPGKKFRCEKCSRAFVRRDALRRHHCERAADHMQRPQPSAAPPYAVRDFSGEMVHQVAYQLMAEAETGASDQATPTENRTTSAISVAR